MKKLLLLLIFLFALTGCDGSDDDGDGEEDYKEPSATGELATGMGGSFTIQGYITDEDDKAINELYVYLSMEEEWWGTTTDFVLLTDENGYFAFSELPKENAPYSLVLNGAYPEYIGKYKLDYELKEIDIVLNNVPAYYEFSDDTLTVYESLEAAK